MHDIDVAPIIGTLAHGNTCCHPRRAEADAGSGEAIVRLVFFWCWLPRDRLHFTVWKKHTRRAVQAHNAPTTAMAVDASGALVATASAMHEVRVWDVPGGFCTHSFSGHTGLILDALFHSRELLLATAGDDGVVMLWDLVTKKKRAALRGHVSAVTAMRWSADERHLLSAGRDKVVVVWDIHTQAKVRTVAVFDSIETMEMLPPGVTVPGYDGALDPHKAMFFVTGGEAGTVKVWDGRTGHCVSTLARGAGGVAAREITALLPMRRARCMLVATADCHIARYACAKSGLALKQTLLGNADQVTALRFAGNADAPHVAASSVVGAASAGGADHETVARPVSLPSRVVLATNSDRIHVLSTANMSCERTLSGHKEAVLALAVAYVPTLACWLAVSGSKDRTVRVWHLERDTCVAVGTGHLSSVNAVALGAKAAPFVVTGGADKLLRVWALDELWAALGSCDNGTTDGAAQAPHKAIKLKVSATVAAHEKELNCVAVAPNNRFVASGGADRVAKLWKLPALAAPLTLRGHKRGVMDVQFAPIDQVQFTMSCSCT